MHQVIKRYGHERGYSVAFRQYKAESHCRFIHGYALAFEFGFTCKEKSKEGWVVDFGGLDRLKQYLDQNFDHKFWACVDDPMINEFRQLEDKGIVDMIIHDDNVNCETFAYEAFKLAEEALDATVDNRHRHVRVQYCKVSEHNGNHAIYGDSNE